MAMAKKLCFIVILTMFLLNVELSRAEEESPSPATSPERETPSESPLPPSSSPDTDSLPPQASSPEAEPSADSPPPPPTTPPKRESPSPSPSPSSYSPSPAPSDDDPDEDPEQETEYFPSPTPSPAQEEGKPDDIKASEDGDEFEKEGDEEDSGGMSGLKKAGIAIGAILGVGAIVIGALVYKKRQDNLTRARYTYFNQGEFL